MSPDAFKVATYNCNSIRARLDLVMEWLARQAPDVLCLQETKVSDDQFPSGEFHKQGYQVLFRGQKAHAGVALVTRVEAKLVSFGLDDGAEPDETRLIRASLGDVWVVNTYVPQGRTIDSPHFQRKLEWFARLRRYFDRQHKPQDLLVWAGDFNVAPDDIDVYDPKRLAKHVDFHPLARQALEEVRDWGFVDVFRLRHPQEAEQYTFWDYRVPNALQRSMGWRVDHVWATRPLAEKCTKAWIDVDPRRADRPSDHTFVMAEFEL
jgi:exodeoxyribonuclease-3